LRLKTITSGQGSPSPLAIRIGLDHVDARQREQEPDMSDSSVLQVSPALPSYKLDWGTRTIPLSRASHVCGRVPLAVKAAIEVESRLESQVVRYLARQPHLVAIHAQPFTLHYQDRGRCRRYTPDLLVVFEQVPRHLRRRGFDRWTAIEVKPASRVDAAVIDRLASVARHLGLATACLTECDVAGEFGHEE